MPAEWKKSALERAKKRDELKALREENALLKDKLTDAQSHLFAYKDRLDHLTGALNASVKNANRYDALRMKGVLIDQGGEFKYLQGKDLDDYFDERARTYAESMAAKWNTFAMSTPHAMKTWLNPKGV